MALPVKIQLRYWGIATAVFFILLWFLGDVILPFILGGAIAYFLDPVADRLENMGLSRIAATGVITCVAILLFILAILLIIPTMIRQTSALVETAPELFQRLQAFLNDRFPSALEEGSALRQSIASLGDTIRERGGQLVNGLLTTASSLLNIVMLLVIVPVVSVYMLLDWDRMVAKVDNLLPRDHAPVVRRLATEIDRTLAAFIRGQGTVCLILGTFYGVALMLVGLQFGLVIGAIAGILVFIPYVGTIVGGALAIGVALFQFWGSVPVTDGDTIVMTTNWMRIGIVVGIFVFGQIIEGNFLTPKLVGGSVGLHPVWLLFALSTFGALFGFVGLLVAVPVAAALGVLARFVLEKYTNSQLYWGVEGQPAPPQEDVTKEDADA